MNVNTKKWGVRALSVALLLACLLTLCACREKASIEGISLNATTLTMEVGTSKTLEVTVTPAEVTDLELEWKSSNEKVVAVENGVLKALAEGEAVITVKTTTKEGDFEASVSVKVISGDALTHVAATAPTCTKEGNIEYWRSEQTGKCYLDADGKTEAAASELTVSATGHTAGTAASCEEASYCTVCGELMAAATGHTAGAAASCEEASYCTVCGELVEAATGHTVGTAASCESAAYCTVCNKLVSEALGHEYGAWNVVKAPTTDAAGSAEQVCSRDDSHINTMTLPALSTANGYSYAVTTAPTAEKGGEGAYSLTYDGQTFTFSVTLTPLAHNYNSGVIKTAATCTRDGLKVYTCKDCGKTYEEVIRATGHRYGSYQQTVAPTCTTTGVMTSKCYFCASTLTKTVEALGHAYGDWETSVAPTETTEGILIKTCANDTANDHAKTAVAPALTKANYTAVDTEDYTVSYQEKDIACGEPRVAYFTITKDGTSIACTVDLEILEHTYSDWTLVKAPTPEETGLLVRTCLNTVCSGDTNEAHTIPAMSKSADGYTYVSGDGKDVYTYTFNGADHVFELYTVTFKYKDADGSSEKKLGYIVYNEKLGQYVSIEIPEVAEKTADGNRFVKWSIENLADITRNVTIEAVYEAVPMIVAGDATVKDNIAEVEFTLANPPALFSLMFTVRYDASILSLEGYTFNDSIEQTRLTVTDTDAVTVSCLSTSGNVDMEGEVVTLKFAVKDGVDAQSTKLVLVIGEDDIDNTISTDDNYEYTYVTLETFDGTVTIP